MDLVSALDAAGNLLCAVGAGGKKSTLYALAARIDRAVVTATVRIPIFDARVAEVVVTDDPAAAVRRAADWPVGVVPEREREDRYRGYDPATVAALADAVLPAGDGDGGQAADDGGGGRAGAGAGGDEAAAGDAGADAVLAKADGARARWLKAPGDHEPRLPPNADVVVPVASVRVVGEPLAEEHVHRVERVAAVAGLDPGEEVRPEHVAAVLASEAGGLKDVPPDATAIPLLNMVDDDAREAAAREVAREVLARAPVERVVLARMIADEPVVAVVE